MSRLTNLLHELEKSDPQLAADIRREVKALDRRRAFGLNFERHVPESVELPGRPIRRGDKVRFVPARDEADVGLTGDIWRVTQIKKNGKKRIAELLRTGSDESERATRDVDDLVAVAEFRDPIYPGLVSTGRVERGGDKPFHTVINAENYHALEALLYTHEGKVDAIYIDPPYNTGAKDWKYNNDYVDGEDQYRHSKWLAMMERRLGLAKRLLNPENSVLVVTIDEKECLRLGLLLEQAFPDSRVQMVTVVINPTGVSRGREFARADEYAFFVFVGKATVSPWTKNMLVEKSADQRTSTIWRSALRSGTNARRQDRPNLFYPVFVDAETERIVEIGASIPIDQSRESIAPPQAGVDVVWPLRGDGSEGNWQIGPAAMRLGIEKRTVRLGTRNAETGNWTINYLREAEKRRLEDGEIIQVGVREDGTPELAWSGAERKAVAVTVWNVAAHDAGTGGSNVLRALLPSRRFPFPKSLFAVEDSLRFFVADNPQATVVDFFAGSGTTAHAVMRLNKQDGGQRKTILVTNNEVAADEQIKLRKNGLRPGDPAWEALGICEYITKPRVEAAVTGKTPDGESIKGDYKFTDEFPMADGFQENVEFFNMTYEAPLVVAHNKAFDRIAPLLWLRAGAEGRRIEQVPSIGYDVADSYGVLFDVDKAEPFVAAVGESPNIRIAYIVSDDERAFQAACADLPDGVEPVRLYSSYLTNFELNVSAE